MLMERQKRLRIMEFGWPLFAALGFVLGIAYKIFLAWWLDPWLQRKANRALLDDIKANLYFLVSEGQLVNSRRSQVLPFDYASVQINYGNILFCITRGRGGVNVSVSPRYAPGESYELGRVVAALERRHLSECDLVNTLSGVGSLLRPHLQGLNDAFSETEYPGFRDRLHQ